MIDVVIGDFDVIDENKQVVWEGQMAVIPRVGDEYIGPNMYEPESEEPYIYTVTRVVWYTYADKHDEHWVQVWLEADEHTVDLINAYWEKQEAAETGGEIGDLTNK